MSNLKTFTPAQVAAHNTPTDLWLIVNDGVYDLTEFQKTHPGGEKILIRMAGKDATKPFKKKHNERILMSEQYKVLCVGKVVEPAEEKKESRFGKLFGRKNVAIQTTETELVVVERKTFLDGEVVHAENTIKVVSVTDKIE